MKKSIIAAALFFVVFQSTAQENEFGKVVEDTLFMNNGARFVKKEKIKMGYGSNGSRGFEFVYTSPMSMAGMMKLPSSWSNMTMVIKDFKSYGTKRTGKKFYIVLGGGNIVNYWCDITPAIELKEILVPGINDGKQTASAAPVSVADELKKLKELLDSKAITQEEYDAMKKKLLN